jgi:hypothetical protein
MNLQKKHEINRNITFSAQYNKVTVAYPRRVEKAVGNSF